MVTRDAATHCMQRAIACSTAASVDRCSGQLPHARSDVRPRDGAASTRGVLELGLASRCV
ncbi:hypothetical protein BI312_13030 [Xanthomonas citri pv. citri]|nr:hypothetical protein BI314_01945 [Xanthomonas citri pv. citri]QYF47266.1 hypothetical protein HZS93_04647 [Xanthomonas citri]APR15614.1 hypothetical protein BI315_12960 [Xanthomonas citri pv. citri]APR18349.1 hypothetical protein BI316_01000 [Xanthomonas citri pv. citri]APR25610.1 hypothetical protein BJD09_16935 [Xanthomonas citri pv. citri]